MIWCDYFSSRVGLRAIRVNLVGIDTRLIFENYCDDGHLLDYALWIERLGLGRSEDELLDIAKVGIAVIPLV